MYKAFSKCSVGYLGHFYNHTKTHLSLLPLLSGAVGTFFSLPEQFIFIAFLNDRL